MSEIDDKARGKATIALAANRVRIPAMYRMFLGNNFSATIGDGQYCMLIPSDRLDKVLKAYDVDDPFLGDRIEAARQINMSTFRVELDAQERITLNNAFKEICPPLKEDNESITFIGMGDYIEMWPSTAYNKKFGAQDRAAALANILAGLRSKVNG